MDQLTFTGKSTCERWHAHRFKPTKCADCSARLSDHTAEAVTQDEAIQYLAVVAAESPSNLVLPCLGDMGELYIGSMTGAMRKNLIPTITAVVQTARGLEQFFPNFGKQLNAMETSGEITVHRTLWLDAHDQDFLANGSLVTALRFVHSLRQAGTNVLVSCAQGKSRSGSLVVAYLMSVPSELPFTLPEQPTTESEAEEQYATLLSFLQKHRGIVEPNASFKRQLLAFLRSEQLRDLRIAFGPHVTSCTGP